MHLANHPLETEDHFIGSLPQQMIGTTTGKAQVDTKKSLFDLRNSEKEMIGGTQLTHQLVKGVQIIGGRLLLHCYSARK